jgi:phosphohistidine phosphatase
LVSAAIEETRSVAKGEGKKKKGKRRLYLLRHAKAVLSGDDVDDMPRRLAEHGHQQMAALLDALRDDKFEPALTLVSRSRRTLETLDHLRGRIADARIETRDDLYLAPAATLLAILRGLDDELRDVLLIGHNPGLHELAVALLSPDSVVEKPKLTRRLFQGFPTAALVEFEIHGRWAELNAAGGKLRRFLRPKDLLTPAEP